MQKGTSDDEAVRTKLWAFAALALAYVLLYRKRAPDWVKLLGVAPAGVGVALAVQLAQIWPPSSELALRLGVVVAAVVVALAGRLIAARVARAPVVAPPSELK
jgi:peptidoglycan/LPS O-acetylase OafA/YrhL